MTFESKASEKISQSYLSQIGSGARPHLTNTTRLLPARFFQVHPGYLVDDPEGYHPELLSYARVLEDKLYLCPTSGAELFAKALLTVARHDDSRSCLLLLESVLETPTPAEVLLQLLRGPEVYGVVPGWVDNYGLAFCEQRFARHFSL